MYRVKTRRAGSLCMTMVVKSRWIAVSLIVSVGILVLRGLGADDGLRAASVPALDGCDLDARTREASIPTSAASDLAWSCLALGTVDPPLSELDDELLQATASFLTHLTDAYVGGEFEAFLRLNRAGVSCASAVSTERLFALHDVLREAGVAASALSNDWIACLRVYWSTVYSAPAMQRLLPGRTTVRIFVDETTDEATNAFEDLLRAVQPAAASIEHAMALPACERSKGKASMCLAVEYEAPDGAERALLLRLILNAETRSWSVVRGISRISGADSGSHQPVLVL